MPTYRVTDPRTGRTVRLTGDSPPSEAELVEIFAKLPRTELRDWAPQSGYTPLSPNQERTARRRLAGAAPAIGGTVGGLLGGIPGAAAGGMVGSRVGQYLNAPEAGLPPAGEAIAENLTSGAMQGGLQAGGALLSAGLSKAAPRLMQSALKPSRALLKEYRTTAPRLVQNLLDEGVAVTRSGLTKLQTLLAATNDDIAAAVAATPGQIQKGAVAARAVEPAAQIAKRTNPKAGLATVADEVEAFLDHPVYRGATLTPAEAQGMKTATYREIGDSYGELSSAAVETKKALARGLKEELAAISPGLDKLNARDSSLMAMVEAVGNRVAQANNRDPVGFAWVTSHPMTFLTALMDRSPAVKSHLANGAYRAAAAAAQVPVVLVRAAMTALVSSNDSEEQE